MVFVVSEQVRAKCLDYDVHIKPGAQFGFDGATSIAVEAPADIMSGTFDIDLLAAFSFIGDLEPRQCSLFRHVNLIGRFCSIAGGVAAGPAEHPIDWVSTHSLFCNGRRHWAAGKAFRERNPRQIELASEKYVAEVHDAHPKIQIGNDVWIGEGVFIRRGVSIGDGAIIASHAVVSRDVPPYAIVGGVPAKIIRYRFEPAVIEELLALQWWQYGLSAMDGVCWTDMDLALWQIGKNIEEGRAEPYVAPILNITANEVDVLTPADRSHAA